jgi:hypothetical protein
LGYFEVHFSPFLKEDIFTSEKSSFLSSKMHFSHSKALLLTPSEVLLSHLLFALFGHALLINDLLIDVRTSGSQSLHRHPSKMALFEPLPLQKCPILQFFRARALLFFLKFAIVSV